MRARLEEPGVEEQYEACLKAYRDLKTLWIGLKNKVLQRDMWKFV